MVNTSRNLDAAAVPALVLRRTKPEDEFDTLLTLEFNEVDGGTELMLTHEQLASVESRDRHEHGWTAIME